MKITRDQTGNKTYSFSKHELKRAAEHEAFLSDLAEAFGNDGERAQAVLHAHIAEYKRKSREVEGDATKTAAAF